MATQAEALERLNWQAPVKLYIKNDAGTYVDFTERFGEDRLKKLPPITHKAEGKHGQPVTAALTITVGNEDRYWNQDVPAAFGEFIGKDVQIRFDIADASEATLCTMRIAPDGITTDDGPTAQLKLEPLAETLARADASGFKQGADKYQNRTWLSLAKDILRSEFGDAAGDLPSSYEFPSSSQYTYPDSAKHFSSWGKPPHIGTALTDIDNTSKPCALDYDSANDILYVGIAEKLYSIDRSTGVVTDLGEDDTEGVGVTVRVVYVCTDGVVVCKWDDSATAVYEASLFVTFYDTTAEDWDSSTRDEFDDFFSGTFHVFNGSYVTSTRQLKGYVTGLALQGVNTPVPFEQYITTDFGTNNTVELARAPGLATATGDTATWLTVSENNGEGRTAPAGWWVSLRGEAGVSDDFESRFAWGNKPNLAFDRLDSTSDAYLSFVYYDTATSKCGVKRLTINQGDAITETNMTNLATAVADELIYGLTLDINKTNYSMIIHTESIIDTGYDLTEFKLIDYAGTPPFNFGAAAVDNTDDDNEGFFVDILAYDSTEGSGGKAIVMVLCADRAGKWPQYKIMGVDLYTSAFTLLDSSLGYFVTNRKQVAAAPFWAIDTQSGTVKKFADYSSAPTVLDGGLPPVHDSLFCADFAPGTGADPDIFGLAMPYHHPETQETVPEGKYYLWQYTTQHTGRVDLADFEGLNKLEAVSLLCDAFHHSVFVAPDGDWIITPRDPSGTPSDTISKSLFGSGWLTLRQGKSTDIINYIEYVPYASVLKPMETKLYQKASSPYNGNVLSTQLDTGERRVKLRCIMGGRISEPVDGTDPADSDLGPRFDFLTYYGVIETMLGAAYASGASVTLESVWDIEVGDTIQVVDSAEKTITAVDTATKIVTINSAFGDAYPILSPVRISNANNNKWSSQGVTILAEALDNSETGIDVDNAVNIAVLNRIIVDAEEMVVTAISGNTLTVTRGDNAANHDDNSTVGCIVKPAGLGKWTEIGGQHITVAFDYDGNDEKRIQAGDFVEFVCPGMVLEPRKGSKIIEADQTSIEKCKGKRKMKSRIKNRFLTAALAEYKLNAIVSRRKDKKRVTSVGMGMNLVYRPKDIFYLESEELFPDETGDKIGVIVQDVIYDPMRNKTTYVTEEQ